MALLLFRTVPKLAFLCFLMVYCGNSPAKQPFYLCMRWRRQQEEDSKKCLKTSGIYCVSCFLVKQNQKSGLSKFFPKAEWYVTEPQIFTTSEQSLKAEYIQYTYWGPKTSLKIRTASAIFWNYPGIFRDYGLKHIFFCFSR